MAAKADGLQQRIQAVKARLDYKGSQVEAWASEPGGHHGGQSIKVTPAQLRKHKMREAAAKVTKGRKAVRAGRAGVQCGGGWISAVYTCHVNNAAGPYPMAPPKIGARTRKDLAERGREHLAVLSDPEKAVAGEEVINREAMQKALEKQGITPAHVGALAEYTASGYGSVNEYMANGSLPGWSDLARSMTKDRAVMISDLLARLPEFDGPIYRGISMPTAAAAEIKVGRSFKSKTFQSTSQLQQTAAGFAGAGRKIEGSRAVLMEFAPGHGGRDISGLSEFRNEKEVLIPAAERFTVLSVKDDCKMIQVKVKRA